MNENSKSLYAFLGIVLLGSILIQVKRTGSSIDITENEIMGHIRYLSHEKREGRAPGTRGSKDAISYIIRKLKSYGVEPGANNNSFVQPFDITSGIELGKKNQIYINDRELITEEEYIPLSFSGSGEISAMAVFAGYGFKINREDLVWNDYSDIDVRDKWAIVMRHGPERNTHHSKYADHMPLHKKMLVARDEGAVGIIFISQLEDQELYPLKYISGYNNLGIPAIHLSNKVADEIFKRVGWTRQTIQETMNRSLEPITFDLPSTTIKGSVSLNPIYTRSANVIGIIKSGNREFRDEHIVIGAHFDHVGMGGEGSTSRKPGERTLHPGADDNASGIAGLLELAQKLTAQKSRLKRSVLLIGFDAEEKGLLGSKFYLKNPTIDVDNIITMINMDMIGRVKDSTVTAGGVGTSPSFKSLLDSLSLNRDFNLTMTMPGAGPSDHASFYARNIPVMFFFSGFHNEYHTPDDTWKLINLKGEKDILDLIYDVVFHLARTKERPEFVTAGAPPRQPQTRANFKVSLRIVPSYSNTEPGLKVDAISSADGPAALAGIREGDLIKSINGKQIKDIYEYMDRMGELEKGTTIPIVVERNGSQIELNVSF